MAIAVDDKKVITKLLEKNKNDVVKVLQKLIEMNDFLVRNNRYSRGRRGTNRRRRIFRYPSDLTITNFKEIIANEKNRLLAKYKKEGACSNFGENTYRRLQDLISYYDISSKDLVEFKKELNNFKNWINKYKTKSKKFSPVKK